MPPEEALASETEETEEADLEERKAEFNALAAEIYGEDFDPDNFETFVSKEEDWNAQHNATQMELAEKGRDLDEQKETWADRISKADTPRVAAQPVAARTKDEIRAEFFRQAGIEDPEADLTGIQLANAMELAQNWVESKLGFAFGNYYNPDGTLNREFVNVRNLTDIVEGVAKDNETLMRWRAQDLSEKYIGELMGEFPNADEDGLWDKLNSLDADTKDIEGVLKAEAKKQHDRFESKVSKATKSETKRRSSARSKATMAGGTGGAVAGKKMPNPWTAKGMRELHRSGVLQTPGKETEE